MGKPDKGRARPVGSPLALFGLGIEMAVPIVICVYAGYRLDRWLDTSPWWSLAGALLGVTLGFYSFFRRVMPFWRGPNGDRR